MILIALRTDGNHRYSWMKNRRSLLVNRTRPRTFRCSTVSSCRSAAFSASSRLLDLKSEAIRFNNRNISAAIVADVRRFCYEIIWTRFLVRTGVIAANRARSRVRARSEHVFGTQESAPGGRIVRTIGIVRARLKIGLQNFAYFA
jgi:hypothetical protein